MHTLTLGATGFNGPGRRHNVLDVHENGEKIAYVMKRLGFDCTSKGQIWGEISKNTEKNNEENTEQKTEKNTASTDKSNAGTIEV